jgi:tellurite resistance protein TehA-like permease
MKSSILLPEFFKTSQITTSSGFGRWVATVTMVCCGNCGFVFFFFFLFILVQSLKNHSKLQKNHKIKNSILLDST